MVDGVGAVLLHIHQPIHEPVDLITGVFSTIDGIPGSEDPLGLLQGIVPGIDGGGSHRRIADGDLVTHGFPDGVHQGGGRGAAMVGECIGVAGFLGEQHLCRFRILVVHQTVIEGIIGLLGVILPCHHLVTHILGDGENLSGGKAHIQMVAFHNVLHILQSW